MALYRRILELLLPIRIDKFIIKNLFLLISFNKDFQVELWLKTSPLEIVSTEVRGPSDPM